MAETDILTATENYGKAKTAFALALNQAAQTRQQAMFDLGADYIQQGGNTLTPDAVGKALGGEGFDKPTAMKTGFGTRGLSLIAQEQAGTAYQQDVAAQERGLTAGSGVRESSRLIAQEAGQEATEQAVRESQARIAEANAQQAAAKIEELNAKAEYDTVTGKTTTSNTPGGGRNTPGGGRPNETKQEAAKRRASARAAANAKAKAAGKPLPYPKPNQGPPPVRQPAKKKGKK